MTGLRQEPQAFVQCEYKLSGGNIVSDYVYREDGNVHASVDLAQQDDWEFELVGRAELGVVTCGRSRTVVIAEQPALDLGICVGSVRR